MEWCILLIKHISGSGFNANSITYTN